MKISIVGKRSRILFPVILLILFVLFILDMTIGSVSIPIKSIINIIFGIETKESWINIFYNWRLPKALTAILAGACLSIAGLLMQTLFRNPLAGPSILGISSGAGLGVAILIMGSSIISLPTVFTGAFGMALSAITGSGIILLLLILASRKIESNLTILILGIMIGYISSAAVTILFQITSDESMRAYVNWSYGSFSAVTWAYFPVLVIGSIIGLVSAFLLVKPLNALLLGDKYAQSLGINYLKIRLVILITTAVLTGVITAFCGPIGFIGIAVPHLCRSLFISGDHRILLPACVIMGGIIAVASDIIAQVPCTDYVLPLNAVTSLFGAPIVIWIILQGTKYGRSVTT